MSTEFTREDRYIVFKVSDVERYLTDADRAYLAMMKNEIDAGRGCANKPPFKGLIVEADWPEYEPTWKAIEARVMGAQPAPSVPDIDYLVDTLSEFADHHVEHGRMSFDKWTLRSAVEAMLAAAQEAKP